MKGRIRIDRRFLERLQRERLAPKPEVFSRVERYNAAAAQLGLTFEKAVAEGRLSEVTAMAEALRSTPAE